MAHRLPAPVLQLIVAVAAYDTTPPVASHARLEAALRALTAALLYVPGVNPTTAASARQSVNRLVDAPVGSDAHADFTRAALSSARKSLPDVTSFRQHGHSAAEVLTYETVLALFDKALGGVNPDVPLLQQQAAVAATLRSATDAVLVACGNVPVYAAVGAEARTETVSTALAAARTRTRELAAAEWMKSQPQLAAALAALGDVLAAADPGTLREHVARIQYAAGRLGRPGLTGEPPTQLARDALAAALDAARSLEGAKGPIDLEPFFAEAHAAVAAIDVDRPISFERTQLQDAIRAVLDAVALATSGGGTLDPAP